MSRTRDLAPLYRCTAIWALVHLELWSVFALFGVSAGPAQFALICLRWLVVWGLFEVAVALGKARRDHRNWMRDNPRIRAELRRYAESFRAQVAGSLSPVEDDGEGGEGGELALAEPRRSVS